MLNQDIHIGEILDIKLNDDTKYKGKCLSLEYDIDEDKPYLCLQTSIRNTITLYEDEIQHIEII